MIILTFIFMLIDLISKYIISKSISVNEGIVIIRNFFNITYVKNTGVAFSMFDDDRYFIIIVSFFIIGGIIYYIYKNRPKSNIEKVAYSLILGGAIGNFINRIVCGYVTDFIDLNIFGYNYPIFNLADTFIVIGVILLMIYSWRYGNGNKGHR